MRAAVLTGFGQPLELQHQADPVPGPAEAIIATRASGMCRTDLKIANGFFKTVEVPRVLGHEVAGEVVAVGRDVDAALVGERVITLLDISCGTCDYCRGGRRTYCANLRRLGIEADGGHGEYVAVPAENLVSLPSSIPFDVASALPDAVGTSYRAIHSRGQIEPGQVVVVYGLGGLGLSAVQIAVAAGARVIGISRSAERKELAASLGASLLIDPNENDFVDSIREATTGYGCDLFVDFVGIEGSVERAVKSCRKGGRVIVVGYMVPAFNVTAYDLLVNEVEILGSRSVSKGEIERVVQLVADGVLNPVIAERVPLENVNEAYRRIADGETVGRAVIVFA